MIIQRMDYITKAKRDWMIDMDTRSLFVKEKGKYGAKPRWALYVTFNDKGEESDTYADLPSAFIDRLSAEFLEWLPER